MEHSPRATLYEPLHERGTPNASETQASRAKAGKLGLADIDEPYGIAIESASAAMPLT